jgi:chemotaxis response regulator CheB
VSEIAGIPGKDPRRRAVPVTDPVRVLLVDSDAASGNALSRAIDMDRELAVVGVCRDPRRIGAEADHCRPDLVAIRLGLDDERCVTALSDLASSSAKACVVVLGAAQDNPAANASAMKNRIREVAEVNFGIAPEPVQPPPHWPGQRLH